MIGVLPWRRATAVTPRLSASLARRDAQLWPHRNRRAHEPRIPQFRHVLSTAGRYQPMPTSASRTSPRRTWRIPPRLPGDEHRHHWCALPAAAAGRTGRLGPQRVPAPPLISCALRIAAIGGLIAGHHQCSGSHPADLNRGLLPDHVVQLRMESRSLRIVIAVGTRVVRTVARRGG